MGAPLILSRLEKKVRQTFSCKEAAGVRDRLEITAPYLIASFTLNNNPLAPETRKTVYDIEQGNTTASFPPRGAAIPYHMWLAENGYDPFAMRIETFLERAGLGSLEEITDVHPEILVRMRLNARLSRRGLARELQMSERAGIALITGFEIGTELFPSVPTDVKRAYINWFAKRGYNPFRIDADKGLQKGETLYTDPVIEEFKAAKAKKIRTDREYTLRGLAAHLGKSSGYHSKISQFESGKKTPKWYRLENAAYLRFLKENGHDPFVLDPEDYARKLGYQSLADVDRYIPAIARRVRVQKDMEIKDLVGAIKGGSRGSGAVSRFETGNELPVQNDGLSGRYLDWLAKQGYDPFKQKAEDLKRVTKPK